MFQKRDIQNMNGFKKRDFQKHDRFKKCHVSETLFRHLTPFCGVRSHFQILPPPLCTFSPLLSRGHALIRIPPPLPLIRFFLKSIADFRDKGSRYTVPSHKGRLKSRLAV